MRYYLTKGARFGLSLLLVACLNFLIPRAMPGSPVFTLLGPDVIGLSGKDYEALERELGLDRPLAGQLARYLSGAARGRLGYSYYYHRPVAELIGDHMGRTLLILIPALVLSSVLAAFCGTWAGYRPGSGTDLVMTGGFLLAYTVPVFLLAMLALDILAFRLGWFPLSGLGSGGGEVFGWKALAEAARHLCLPVMVLSLSSAAVKYMVMRASVTEVRLQDFVLYARAKGAAPLRILFVHVFRNALLPLVNLIGLHLGFVVSGALLVEVVFSINGMGILIYEAAVNRDYPVLQGCFLVLTLVVLGVNLLVDVVSGWLDPRVRA